MSLGSRDPGGSDLWSAPEPEPEAREAPGPDEAPPRTGCPTCHGARWLWDPGFHPANASVLLACAMRRRCPDCPPGELLAPDFRAGAFGARVLPHRVIGKWPTGPDGDELVAVAGVISGAPGAMGSTLEAYHVRRKGNEQATRIDARRSIG